ncbi:LysR family transcriptional regulator [Rhodopseudomonas sp. BR0M22]|uniref:LysR family transcriptional regulator n=1 Tax=Rhodopseudomonas sp. BR0M22 TaxID=2269369 RepID=UPI0013DF78BA|nr:LysR family transcriptional regulator [Rhodopseudomonas sp. BR0M22]NEW91436.1 LysR family transcriptional regulator [Rhodopseudomonas sp. BR0M22]
MRFDLTDLGLFLAVIDAGSITRGAAEAGLSLAAASERLRHMEAVGEVLLLHRGRRGVVPTEAGEALAHHARTILHQIAEMRGELGRYAKGMRANVCILANTAAVTEYLPARLASWMAQHPRVDVDLKERQSSDIARSVAAGFAEIGILSGAAATAGLTLRPFATDRLVAVLALDHALAGKPQLRFSELLDHHFVGLSGGALQQHLEMQAARLGTKIKLRVALRSFDGICRLAGEGVGIGVVPEAAARRSKRSARIAIVRLQDDWATRRLSVCVRSEPELTPLARSLFQHLASRSSSPLR